MDGGIGSGRPVVGERCRNLARMECRRSLPVRNVLGTPHQNHSRANRQNNNPPSAPQNRECELQVPANINIDNRPRHNILDTAGGDCGKAAIDGACTTAPMFSGLFERLLAPPSELLALGESESAQRVRL